MRFKTCLTVSGTLLMVGVSCQRDQVAPDCFVREDGKCVIADPGTPETLSVDCGAPPLGAVGANYQHAVTFTGPDDVSFMATGLPAGLMLTPTTGEINGTPEQVGITEDVTITITDEESGETEVSTCGPIEIGPAAEHDLFDLPATAPLGCLPIGENIADHITGGDDSALTCTFTSAEMGSGSGNGELPAGLTFDASACSASGTITQEHMGTYVWIVQVEQSGRVLHVPFCATKPLDQSFHTIAATVDAASHDPLAPAIVAFDPAAPLVFGDGDDPRFAITEACAGGSCNNWGFEFVANASPFDPPFSFENSGSLDDGMGTNIGFFHGVQLSTQGKITGEQENGDRTWVINLTNWYCTSANQTDCDGDSDTAIKENAQTQFTWSVIAHPQ